MMDSQPGTTKLNFIRRLWNFLKRPFLIGFIIGISFSLGGKALGWDLGKKLEELGFSTTVNGSSFTALAIGCLLVFVSVFVAAGTLFLGQGLKMKMFIDRQDWEDQRGLFRLSALGCFSWGALLIALALVEPLELPVGIALVSVLSVFSVMLGYSCWMILQEYDELLQEINQTMCT